MTEHERPDRPPAQRPRLTVKGIDSLLGLVEDDDRIDFPGWEARELLTLARAALTREPQPVPSIDPKVLAEIEAAKAAMDSAQGYAAYCRAESEYVQLLKQHADALLAAARRPAGAGALSADEREIASVIRKLGIAYHAQGDSKVFWVVDALEAARTIAALFGGKAIRALAKEPTT